MDREPPKVQLEYPVRHGSEEIDELVGSERLKAKHLMGISTNDVKFDDMVTVASRLFGVPTSVIKELDAVDLAKVVGVISDFLAPFRRIGEAR